MQRQGSIHERLLQGVNIMSVIFHEGFVNSCFFVFSMDAYPERAVRKPTSMFHGKDEIRSEAVKLLALQ